MDEPSAPVLALASVGPSVTATAQRSTEREKVVADKKRRGLLAILWAVDDLLILISKTVRSSRLAWVEWSQQNLPWWFNSGLHIIVFLVKVLPFATVAAIFFEYLFWCIGCCF